MLIVLDFQRQMIDSRLVVLYVSTLYEKLKELEPMKVSELILEINNYCQELLHKIGQFYLQS